jgi:hypothetical protein
MGVGARIREASCCALAVAISGGCAVAVGPYHGVGKGDLQNSGFGTGVVGNVGVWGNVRASNGFAFGTSVGGGHTKTEVGSATVDTTGTVARFFFEWVNKFWDHHSIGMNGTFDLLRLEEEDGAPPTSIQI